MVGVWNWMVFKVPSELSHSVVLLFLHLSPLAGANFPTVRSEDSCWTWLSIEKRKEKLAYKLDLTLKLTLDLVFLCLNPRSGLEPPFTPGAFKQKGKHGGREAATGWAGAWYINCGKCISFPLDASDPLTKGCQVTELSFCC